MNHSGKAYRTRSGAVFAGILKGIYLFFGLLLLLLVVLVGIFLVLYLIKSLLGIDVFPGKHITDWF